MNQPKTTDVGEIKESCFLDRFTQWVRKIIQDQWGQAVCVFRRERRAMVGLDGFIFGEQVVSIPGATLHTSSDTFAEVTYGVSRYLPRDMGDHWRLYKIISRQRHGTNIEMKTWIGIKKDDALTM